MGVIEAVEAVNERQKRDCGSKNCNNNSDLLKEKLLHYGGCRLSLKRMICVRHRHWSL